jgi:hypothetical protein
MLYLIISLLIDSLERTAQTIFGWLLYISLAIAVGHYCGWVERWIWFVLEKEARKIFNGAQVTIGSFRLDWSAILQGKIIAEVSNAVLHTPDRDLWGWESPLIARVGKAKVEVNAPVTIFHELILRMKLPLEIYSVYISDVQVFVERHDQVINVYLCDPAAVLPTPPYLNVKPVESERDDKLKEPGDLSRSNSGDQEEIDGSEAEDDTQILTGGNPSGMDGKEKHKEQAQKLVHDMLHAVHSLGRAAQTGSLNTAVKQQGIEIAEILRDGLSNRRRNTSELQQGVALMEEVGKMAVESLKTPKLILPQRSVRPGMPQPPKARVGRILLKDIRIFTKDSWIQMSQDAKKNKTTKYKEDTGVIKDAEQDEDAQGLKKGNWNKPIFIQTLVVRAAELCPPMSMKDEDDQQFPALYQRIDKIVEIVWRRLLAEMAKSNGGRLFSTAIGEVLSFIQSNPQQVSKYNKSAPTPKATSSSVSQSPKVPNMATSITNSATPKRCDDTPEVHQKLSPKVVVPSLSGDFLDEVSV